MFRSIVVPLDGSSFAEQALPLAQGLARKTGGTLHLVRVHGLYAFSDPRYSWLPYDPALDAQCKEQELAYLEEIARRAAEEAPLATTSTVMSGMVADGILSHAQSKAADLVVMTTHGRGPVSRAFLGSVADELMRRVSTPVLVVRPQQLEPDKLAQAELRQVLVPVDLSPLAEQILEPVLRLARLTGAAITLLNALEPPHYHGPDAGPVALGAALAHEQRHAEEAGAYLERLADRLRGQGLVVRTRLVRGQHAATAIVEESGAGYDLVALSTRGRGGVKRMLLGSVADKVVRGASIPILVYCPPHEAASVSTKAEEE
jgi:nucleotide-binding universal stress UspA family protein